MSEHPQGQKHCSFCGKTQSEVGKLIAGETKCIDIYDKNLTLKGLKLIADKNKR